jgi:hypothetical protein
MTESVLNQFMPWFAFLLDKKGFVQCPSAELELIADGHVELKAGPGRQPINFKLRFVIDRGQPFVEIAESQERGQWFDLSLIRSLVSAVEFLQVSKVDELGRFLEADYEKVNDLFSAANLPSTLNDLALLEVEQAKKLFPRAFEGQN